MTYVFDLFKYISCFMAILIFLLFWWKRMPCGGNIFLFSMQNKFEKERRNEQGDA